MRNTMNYSGFSDILKTFRRGDEVASHPQAIKTLHGNKPISIKYSSCPPYLEVGLSAKKYSSNT